MSLPTLQKVEKSQRALRAKAKESPEFRFYSLYDKVYRTDVLAVAYERCKANGKLRPLGHTNDQGSGCPDGGCGGARADL